MVTARLDATDDELKNKQIRLAHKAILTRNPVVRQAALKELDAVLRQRDKIEEANKALQTRELTLKEMLKMQDNKMMRLMTGACFFMREVSEFVDGLFEKREAS